jgi:formylglycine-generating enzyme required for sulfatase activity
MDRLRRSMSSLTDLPELIGFFSYSREDDEDSYGALSALRERIQRELRGQLGRSMRTFRLWQDKEAIAAGKQWEVEIKDAVAESAFFIPIVTPTVVRSHFCRFELESFLAREAALDRNDLVFPILYIKVPELDDRARLQSDSVLSIIAKRQYLDWREFRLRDVNSTDVKEAIERFCANICDTLRRSWLSPEERKAMEETAAAQRDEAERKREEDEAKRRAEEERRLAADAQARQRADEERRRRDAEAEQRRAKAAQQRTEERLLREEAAAKRRAEQEERRRLGASEAFVGLPLSRSALMAGFIAGVVLLCMIGGWFLFAPRTHAPVPSIPGRTAQAPLSVPPVPATAPVTPISPVPNPPAPAAAAAPVAPTPLAIAPTQGIETPRSITRPPLSLEQERALKPKDSFWECDNCPEMVVVPAGNFIMGAPETEEGTSIAERPQLSVKMSNSFAVGRFAVTFDEWDACVADGGCDGYKPKDQGWGRGRQPVINVSWKDAKAYVAWLAKKTSKPYRLLSEAEREYVTRAGTATPFWWGNSISTNQANYNGNDIYGKGVKGEYRARTLLVKSFEPNPWGLYQVHGNVFEWTEDCYHDSYQGAPTDGSAWTGGDCSERVVRGGCWRYAPWTVRSANRASNLPVLRNSALGFRVARALTP